MLWVYRVFEAPGAALPSSHVAVALCTVFFSFRYLRRIRYVHLAVAVLLCLATVYCRYHYVVDVLAGLLMVSASPTPPGTGSTSSSASASLQLPVQGQMQFVDPKTGDSKSWPELRARGFVGHVPL